MSDSLAPRFHTLFIGSSKSHGSFVPTGEYDGPKQKGPTTTEPGPASLEHWLVHLEGHTGVGACPLLDDGTCIWGCVDIDIYDGLNHGQIAALLVGHGLPALCSRSRSGGAHVYVFAKEPVSSDLMVARLGEIARLLGHPRTELFPKQTSPTTFGGNWVNMPYFDGDNTTRYGVNAAGDALSPVAFLDAAEALKASAEWFSKPLTVAGTPAPEPRSPKKRFTVPEEIGEGQRDMTLTSIAGKLRRDGWDAEEILPFLRTVNETRCKPPMDDADVARIARSVGRYEPADNDEFHADASGVYHQTTNPKTGRIGSSKISLKDPSLGQLKK
jgi:hypothetical protein